MASIDTTPPPILPLTTPIPMYLNPMTQILFGLTATTRSFTLTTFSLAWGVYWLFDLAMDKRLGNYSDVYIAGCTLFSAVFKILSAGFLMEGRDFERRRRGGGGKKGVEGEEGEKKGNVVAGGAKGVLQGGLDVLELGFMSPRGVGWNFQIRNLPPTPARETPRLPFAAKHLASAAIDLLLVDLSHYHLRHNSPVATLPIKPLTSQPLPLALVNAWLIYLQARWTTNALYKILAAVTVPLHIFSPAAFPPLFGSFAHAYTVKRFWSHTWHQMMRTLASPYTNALVKSLRLDDGKKSTYWVKVSFAFFWAWAVHAYGTLIAGGGYTADFYRYVPQIAAFWTEEKVIAVGKRAGFKGEGWKVLGYMWVFMFQGATLVAWFGPAVAKGAYSNSPLGLGVVEWLVGKM